MHAPAPTAQVQVEHNGGDVDDTFGVMTDDGEEQESDHGKELYNGHDVTTRGFDQAIQVGRDYYSLVFFYRLHPLENP